MSQELNLEKRRRIGNNVEIIQNNDPFTALEIHDLQDLKLVNAAYKLRFKNEKEKKSQ